MAKFFAFNADVQGGKPIGYGQDAGSATKMADMLCTMMDKMLEKKVVERGFAPRFAGVERIQSVESPNPEFAEQELAELLRLEHKITNEFRFKAKTVEGL